MSAISYSDNDIVYMDGYLYEAATDGKFQLFENYPQPLDRLLTGKNKNSILHVYLNSRRKRSKGFVENVLGRCPHLLWQINNDGDTPLHIAARYGHHDIVKLFIEEAKMPIHRDLETGEEEAVRRMLRLKNKLHETALHLAVGKSLSVVKEILEHEDPNYTYTPNKQGESPLYLAANNGVDGVAIEVLNKFESLNCSGPNGTTVFHAAVPCYDLLDDDFWDILLKKLGSFVNQADDKGWTPLHYAAYKNKFKVVQLILEKDKSSAYAIDKERNRTALHLASIRGNVEIMKKLIYECPECWEITDVRGWNMLHYAAISGDEEAMRAIMEDSSTLMYMYLRNGEDIKGYSPMQLFEASGGNLSVSRDKKKVLEWMKDLGEDPLGVKIEVRRRWEEIDNEIIPELEKAKDSHLVAAALVATVTFAAAFTLPGGYISDGNDSKLKGTPILSKSAAFKAFVITDAIAMVLSTSSVLIHFVMVMLGYKLRYYWLMRSALWFVVLAMGAMMVAFVTGTYAVLAPNSMELAIATCIIGLTFFVLVFYAFVRLISGFIKRDMAEHRFSSVIDSIERLVDSTPQYLSCGRRNFMFLYNQYCC